MMFENSSKNFSSLIDLTFSKLQEDSNDDFEDVVDNDAGEDLLLQKLAEQSEKQQSDENTEDTETEESSSREFFVNFLKCIFKKTESNRD